MNERPVCFFALLLAAGILLTEFLYPYEKLFRILPLAAAAVSAVVLICIKSKRRFAYLPIAAIIGIVTMSGFSDVYDRNLLERTEGEFEATVASELIIEDRTYFIVEDIIFEGRKLTGKASVILASSVEPQFAPGDTITLSGVILPSEHTPFNTHFATNRLKNLYYSIRAADSEKISDGNPRFPLNLQLKIKKLFYEHTDEYTASICQGLILGEKDSMDDQLKDDIKAAGLAHVLAVSGLHITALASALYFLLKKLKVNPKICFAAVTCLTFLYVMLCSFTPSALRAFIMTVVFMLASTFGFKRDNLSALSVAAILLLLINPISIMNVGFLLSVFAVLGIFLFYRPLKDFCMRGARRIHSPRQKPLPPSAMPAADAPVIRRNIFGKTAEGMVDAISVSLSANIFTLPLVAKFFASVPVLFLLSSVIILPYVMFIYIFLLINTVLALTILPQATVGIMDYLLVPFKAYVWSAGSLDFAQIPAAATVIVIVCYFLCALLLSRFVFIGKRQKILSVSLICTVGLALSCVAGVLG